MNIFILKKACNILLFSFFFFWQFIIESEKSVFYCIMIILLFQINILKTSFFCWTVSEISFFFGIKIIILFRQFCKYRKNNFLKNKSHVQTQKKLFVRLDFSIFPRVITFDSLYKLRLFVQKQILTVIIVYLSRLRRL